MIDPVRRQRECDAFGRGPVIVLLVILAGLVAVVVPLAVRKRVVRDEITGFRNLQQWGIAFNIYLSDHNNRLPSVGSDDPQPDQKEAWYNALPLYLSLTPLTELAQADRPTVEDASVWVDPQADRKKFFESEKYHFWYAMNAYLQPSPDVPPLFIYNLSKPAATVLLVDVASNDPRATPDRVDFRYNVKLPGPEAQANVLFCDGHVARVGKAALVEAPTARSMATREDYENVAATWVPYPGAPHPRLNVIR